MRISDWSSDVCSSDLEMDRDFIILNGDTIISDEIIAQLIAGANEPINVTVDVKADYDDDDMKVNRDAEGRLHHIGKRLLPPDTNAESIGKLAFVGDGTSIFRNQVDQKMRTPDSVRTEEHTSKIQSPMRIS